MKKVINSEYIKKMGWTCETEEPPIYQLMVHHDEFTPIEFSINVVQKFLMMDRLQAINTVLEAKLKGKAVCGSFSKDYAESKLVQISEYINSFEYPLICSMEAS